MLSLSNGAAYMRGEGTRHVGKNGILSISTFYPNLICTGLYTGPYAYKAKSNPKPECKPLMNKPLSLHKASASGVIPRDSKIP